MDVNSMLNKSSAEAQQNTSTSSSNPTSIAQSTSAPVINEFTNQSQSENSNGSNDQQIQSVTQGMSMAQASVTTSSRLPSPSPRRTRANKKPKNIVTDTGSASAQASPHAPKQPSKLSYPPQNIEVEIVNKLDEVQMDVDEFVVPISLPTRVYDQYVEVLHRYSEDHAKFMRNLNPEPVTIRAMEKMIVELDNVVTHPDLLDKTVLDEEVDLAGGELNYGRLSSYKFGLLYAILKEVHGGLSYGIPEGLAEILKGSTQLQMAIVVQEGKLYEILTRFLLLMNISFTSVDDGVQHHQEKQGNLNLIVVSSSFSRPAELPAVDIVYAMDSSYDRQSTLVQSLKGYEGHRTRVLFPWVFASPEHVRACLPLMEGPLDPLRTFTQILVQAVPELGQLKGTWNKPSDKRMDVAGFHLGRWITKGFAEGYPLSGLDGVPLTGLEMVVKPSRKRSLDDSEEDGSSSPSKRRRTSEEIIDGEVPSNDLSPEVEIAALRRQVKVCRSRIHARKSIRQPAKVDDAPVKFERLRQEFLELRAKYQELDAQRLSEVETNYRLMRACDEALDRLGAARRGNRTLSRENKNLLAALEGKSNALDQRGVQMEELRSKIRELQEGERGAPPDGGVVGSTSSSTAESVVLRNEIETHRKEIESLKVKCGLSEGTRAYAFHLYQEASSRAVELAGEVEEKQVEIDRLVPLAQNHMLLAIQAADGSELETTKFALERALVDKEELEEQIRYSNARAGVSTRAQSIAPGAGRSPRVTATSSPPRSRASSRQPGSRATSPVGRVGVASRRGLPGRLAES